MLKWIDNFLKPYQVANENQSLLERLQILEEKYNSLLLDIKHLEEENIETSNCLYELMNSIDAVDARIDILTVEKWSDKNV